MKREIIIMILFPVFILVLFFGFIWTIDRTMVKNYSPGVSSKVLETKCKYAKNGKVVLETGEYLCGIIR